MQVSWGPFKDLSVDEMEALDEQSRAKDAGKLLPSGVRVIDLVEGTGPMPAKDDRIWIHYKVWADGFRAGKVADYSFVESRPYDYILGQPTERIPLGVDEGVLGMREGGWRRLVVPGALAYTRGIRKMNYGPQGRYYGAKAPIVLEPNADAYVDVIMFDGGSGRCTKLLRPPGVSEKNARKLKSLTCSRPYEIY